jgi:hypothetical protein
MIHNRVDAHSLDRDWESASPAYLLVSGSTNLWEIRLMPSDVEQKDDDFKPTTPHVGLESILGSLDPLPDESLDLDSEIADAIAEELSRKESFHQTTATED